MLFVLLAFIPFVGLHNLFLLLGFSVAARFSIADFSATESFAVGSSATGSFTAIPNLSTSFLSTPTTWFFRTMPGTSGAGSSSVVSRSSSARSSVAVLESSTTARSSTARYSAVGFFVVKSSTIGFSDIVSDPTTFFQSVPTARCPDIVSKFSDTRSSSTTPEFSGARSFGAMFGSYSAMSAFSSVGFSGIVPGSFAAILSLSAFFPSALPLSTSSTLFASIIFSLIVTPGKYRLAK